MFCVIGNDDLLNAKWRYLTSHSDFSLKHVLWRSISICRDKMLTPLYLSFMTRINVKRCGKRMTIPIFISLKLITCPCFSFIIHLGANMQYCAYFEKHGICTCHSIVNLIIHFLVTIFQTKYAVLFHFTLYNVHTWYDVVISYRKINNTGNIVPVLN
jgi:hypothetical protein